MAANFLSPLIIISAWTCCWLGPFMFILYNRVYGEEKDDNDENVKREAIEKVEYLTFDDDYYCVKESDLNS